MPDDIDDTIQLDNVVRVADQAFRSEFEQRPPPQTACCRTCKDMPLISTFERAGAEFHCMGCGGWFGFMSPKGMEDTPELDAKYKALLARFEAGERGPVKL
jgi:hypothetical protein